MFILFHRSKLSPTCRWKSINSYHSTLILISTALTILCHTYYESLVSITLLFTYTMLQSSCHLSWTWKLPFYVLILHICKVTDTFKFVWASIWVGVTFFWSFQVFIHSFIHTLKHSHIHSTSIDCVPQMWKHYPRCKRKRKKTKITYFRKLTAQWGSQKTKQLYFSVVGVEMEWHVKTVWGP